MIEHALLHNYLYELTDRRSLLPFSSLGCAEKISSAALPEGKGLQSMKGLMISIKKTEDTGNSVEQQPTLNDWDGYR